MPPEISTRALIGHLADLSFQRVMTLGDTLSLFKTRAFGIFLLIALLPAFLPVPIGMGAISGPLVCLIGLQLLLQRQHPWLPKALSQHPITPEKLSSFRDKTHTMLSWLERFSRPRAEYVVDHPLARAFTGLLLILLGILLALPIPLTNYPFGLILLTFAIALIERDGRLMLISWTLGVIELFAFTIFSRQMIVWASEVLS